MPSLQPGQPGVGRAGARLGHLGKAQVDSVGQNRREQQGLVRGTAPGLEVREVPGETGPLIDFHQQLGDLDVRQQRRSLLDQGLGGLRHRRVQRRDLQARPGGDDGIGQLVGCRQAVDRGKLLLQQRQAALQVLLAIGVNGQRQLAGQLHCGELPGGHQIVLEILELARALHTDIARAQRVLEFGQRAQFIVAPVDALVSQNQPGPARLDERGRRVGRHLAGVVGIHAAQHVDGTQHALGGRRRPQCQNLQELRRITAQRGIALANAVQEIELRRLRELLRFPDAGGERIPRKDRFDGRKGIGAALFGFEQCLADAPVQAHLVVDGLARGLELLLVFVLGRVEQLADDAVVKVDDFIGDGGHAFDGQRHQGRIAPLDFEPG